MLRFALSVMGLLLAGWAQAAGSYGISVSPISVTLDAARPSAAVTLSNGTTESKVIQVSLLRWSHENGEDRFAPADDMLANPAMFRVAPGAQQIVRVGLHARGKADFAAERTYRLFLEEVPETPPVASAPVSGGAALRLMLRFGVPVFVSPAPPKPEAMRWALARAGDQIRLSVTNDGNTHLRLSEVRLQSGDRTLDAPNFAYVFAGETVVWTLRPAAPWPAGAVTVSARTDTGPVHAPLQLQGP